MLLSLASILFCGVTVTLPAEARVRGSEMTLGQLAIVTGDEAQTIERVSAIKLGYAPAPGYSRVMPGWKIQKQIDRELGDLDVSLKGAPSCRIWSETVSVPSSLLETTARTDLQTQLANKDAMLSLKTPIQDIKVPAGSRPYELRSALQPSGVRSGSMSVPVQVLVDGVVYQTVWSEWQVELYEVRSVLSRDVVTGETLSPDLFVSERVRVGLGVRVQPLSGPMLQGAVAVRNLPKGKIVEVHDVRRPEVVSRGDLVYLQVKKGAVTARVAATAMQKGFMGDRIRIVTAAGKREMSAVVRGRELVEINLSRGL